MLGLAGVVEGLIGGNQRLEVVEEIGLVQWADLEVLSTELMLGQ